MFSSFRGAVRHVPRRANSFRVGSVLLAGGLGTAVALHSQVDLPRPQAVKHEQPISSLVRAYIVYTLCSFPTLIDWSPAILDTSLSIPGLRELAEAVVRATFFSQFVGGDTAQDTIPLLRQLRAENKGALIAYSVEVDEHEAKGAVHHNDRSSSHVSTDTSRYERVVEEILTAIDTAADFEDQRTDSTHLAVGGRKTWVAIKITALLQAQSLHNLSSYLLTSRPPNPKVPFPGSPHPRDLDVLYDAKLFKETDHLTAVDVHVLRGLDENLIRICQRAKERGVRIIIDAEHSWYQPAIDAFTLSLSRRFNKSTQDRAEKHINRGQQPIVYGTYQAYLRRTIPQLVQNLEDADRGGYALGVKLVRGAYHPHELEAHSTPSPSISPDPFPPVYTHKDFTDASYDTCAQLLIWHIMRDVHGGSGNVSVGALFGTHNRESCDVILDALVKARLAYKDSESTITDAEGGRGGVVVIRDDVVDRVAVGQLYGMCDALTNYLARGTRSTSPFVIKYVPYGALVEVMPYLSRRAIENKSVLGSAAASLERKQIVQELHRRFFP